MSKIQDYNFLYAILRPFVDSHTKRTFSRFKVRGQKNLPTDGAIIIGVNHSNALMDALVPLASTRERKVFIARADIFKNKNTAKILNWLKILPIYRIRDGYSTVKNNNEEIINKAADVCHDRVKLCLYPEAKHRTKHSLLPLSKGIFHIALRANKLYGHEMPIYIVPTGIEYGDYYRYRSTAMISFGEPINITEYVKNAGDESEAVIMNGLRDMMKERMSELFSYVPDDDDYDAIWELTKIKAGKRGSLVERLVNNRCEIRDILKFKEEKPEKAKHLFEKVNEITAERKKHKISTTSLNRSMPVLNIIGMTLTVLVCLPFYICSAVASLPIWLLSYFILVKLKDFTWRNTVNFGVEFVLHPIIMIVGLVLFLVYFTLPVALAAIIALHFSYQFFMDYREFARIWWSDLRYMLFNKKLRKMVRELKAEWIAESGNKKF